MRVIDPGHIYELRQIDGNSNHRILQFVKRNQPPENYPGNLDHFPGTNMQDVVLCLIDRLRYLMKQGDQLNQPPGMNKAALAYLQLALWHLEMRNKLKKNNLWPKGINMFNLERQQFCPRCGHAFCEHLIEENNNPCPLI